MTSVLASLSFWLFECVRSSLYWRRSGWRGDGMVFSRSWFVRSWPTCLQIHVAFGPAGVFRKFVSCQHFKNWEISCKNCDSGFIWKIRSSNTGLTFLLYTMLSARVAKWLTLWMKNILSRSSLCLSPTSVLFLTSSPHLCYLLGLNRYSSLLLSVRINFLVWFLKNLRKWFQNTMSCQGDHGLVRLLSHFSRVRLCATLSLGFSRQEHWSGLPFPSPMHKSEKWKWSRSVMSDSSRSHGLQPTRLLRPWDFPGKSTGVGCHCLLRLSD